MAGAGTIALRTPGKLKWDARAGKFTNNEEANKEEANKMAKPYIRKGWEL
jgi:hypothetical protein